MACMFCGEASDAGLNTCTDCDMENEALDSWREKSADFSEEWELVSNNDLW